MAFSYGSTGIPRSSALLAQAVCVALNLSESNWAKLNFGKGLLFIAAFVVRLIIQCLFHEIVQQNCKKASWDYVQIHALVHSIFFRSEVIIVRLCGTFAIDFAHRTSLDCVTAMAF
jgi:intracellular septation protein A